MLSEMFREDRIVKQSTPRHPPSIHNTHNTLFLCCPRPNSPRLTGLVLPLFSLCAAALNYENVVETGSETEEEDKLPVSEEDPMINGTGSPASLTNPDASPRAESHGLLTKEEEDDEMRDSGVEHIWPDNDMLSASVDGTGKWEMISYLNNNISKPKNPSGELSVTKTTTKLTFRYFLATVCTSCHSWCRLMV